VADPALARSDQLAELRELLRSKFPGLGVLDQLEYGVLGSGIEALDGLLPGGLPRGALTLLTGGPSCGKTAIALAFVAELLRQGGSAAWVHLGALSAATVAHAGIDGARLLSVRAESLGQARRCVDFLLRWQAFHLVVVDWPGRGGRGADWNRVHRLVTGSPDALLVLAPDLPGGDPLRYCSSLSAEVAREGRFVEVELVKSRYQRTGGRARLARAGMPDAPFSLLSDLPGLGQDWHDEIG